MVGWRANEDLAASTAESDVQDSKIKEDSGKNKNSGWFVAVKTEHLEIDID